MNSDVLKKLTENYGDAFYVLDSEKFRSNFLELKKTFSSIYPKFNIAYSYKTNYTPKLCKIVNESGGLAEVVSDMELEIAFRIGVKPTNIIWNGPYKNMRSVERLLVQGGIVNIDNIVELNNIINIARKYPDNMLRIGIRCNFDIGDNIISRFGFDTETSEFRYVIETLTKCNNVNICSIQCHCATRALNTWKPRAEKMIGLIQSIGIVPQYIDLGGGLFGKMADSLKAQFDTYIPTYKEYAESVAPLFTQFFGNTENAPTLLIEPGSALVGDCMRFFTKVVSIKTVRGKSIATVLGSIYNINPTLNKKNPPLTLHNIGNGERKDYLDLDFGGFTCIESDYLYRHYDGSLAVGDIVEFGNVGSYSVVLKPPFILPNFPMIDISGNSVELIKRGEVFDDLFHTFAF